MVLTTILPLRWQAQSKEKAFSKIANNINNRTIICETQARENEKEENVQAIKSIGRMPWHQEPKKDATNCEKPRGAVNKPRSVGVRMGEPSW